MSTLEERFWPKVDVDPDGCWQWLGHVDPAGYGRIREGGREAPVLYAHRVSFELAGGVIPDGHHLDHLCRNRKCVRPDHLEPVVPRTNTLRGEAPTVLLHNAGVCARGHDASESYRRKSGPKAGTVVYCRRCRRENRAAA